MTKQTVARLHFQKAAVVIAAAFLLDVRKVDEIGHGRPSPGQIATYCFAYQFQALSKADTLARPEATVTGTRPCFER